MLSILFLFRFTFQRAGFLPRPLKGDKTQRKAETSSIFFSKINTDDIFNYNHRWQVQPLSEGVKGVRRDDTMAPIVSYIQEVGSLI